MGHHLGSKSSIVPLIDRLMRTAHAGEGSDQRILNGISSVFLFGYDRKMKIALSGSMG